MSELVERAKALLGGTTPGPWQNVGYGNIQPETVGEHAPIGKIYGKANQRFVAASRRLVPELIEAVEFLESAADHWKSLWQGTVKDSTKVMEERDEALREVERLAGRLRDVAGIAFGESADHAIYSQNYSAHESVLFTTRAAVREWKSNE